MNRSDLLKTRLLASLLLPACSLFAGTACGAQTIVGANGAPINQVAPSSPELASADQRVETTKAKVDQAHRQLSAAKAMVKAAEAELKASRADRDAIALRGTAQQLAEAAAFQAPAPSSVDNSVRQVIVPPDGNRLTPVAAPVTPVPMQMGAKAQLQSFDFNSQPSSSSTATGEAQQDLTANPAPSGAPVPAALKPQIAPEPNSVP